MLLYFLFLLFSWQIKMILLFRKFGLIHILSDFKISEKKWFYESYKFPSVVFFHDFQQKKWKQNFDKSIQKSISKYTYGKNSNKNAPSNSIKQIQINNINKYNWFKVKNIKKNIKKFTKNLSYRDYFETEVEFLKLINYTN